MPQQICITLAESLCRHWPCRRNFLTTLKTSHKYNCLQNSEVWNKYRHTVDSRRGSGLILFELRKEIWGGSRATTIFQSEIETRKAVALWTVKYFTTRFPPVNVPVWTGPETWPATTPTGEWKWKGGGRQGGSVRVWVHPCFFNTVSVSSSLSAAKRPLKRADRTSARLSKPTEKSSIVNALCIFFFFFLNPCARAAQNMQTN